MNLEKGGLFVGFVVFVFHSIVGRSMTFVVPVVFFAMRDGSIVNGCHAKDKNRQEQHGSNLALVVLFRGGTYSKSKESRKVQTWVV